MKVAVVGTGHVGLPTAAALASVGHDVVATDADREKVERLEQGGMPLFEPGLEELVRAEVQTGRLSWSSSLSEALDGAGLAFLCVGTPPRATGEANLSMIEGASAELARQARGPLVVAEKSTVPAGTAERVAKTLSRYRPDMEFAVVSNPEFLREGSAVQDALRPERILVGSDSERGLGVMRELYAPMVEAGSQWIETDLRTAELAKHACNAFLAMKVSFANALARICEAADADVVAVTDVMGADPRIGPAHLSAGLGYGGYCFPKDLQAFERLSQRLGYRFPLLSEIARINEEAVDAAFAKVEDVLWNLEGKRVALLGLSFKPGTDDVRFSPALALAGKLIQHHAHVVGYDPHAGSNAKSEVTDLEVAGDVYSALSGAHCAVIATAWDEFRSLDLERMRELMELPIVVDGRNLLDPATVVEAGFTYIPTGRRPAGH